MHQRTAALVEALLDGVTAHLALQARTGIWPAYSEYLLYAPIVAISSHLRWHVDCEHKLPKAKIGRGDNRRLDFMMTQRGLGLAAAIEVKWPRSPNAVISVTRDVKKLQEVVAPSGCKIDARLLLVAGPHEIAADGSPILRPRLTPKMQQVHGVRALGSGKRAWGVSIFSVEA